MTGLIWGLGPCLAPFEAQQGLLALNLVVLALVAHFATYNLSPRRACLAAFSTGLALPVLAASFFRLDRFGLVLGAASLGTLALVQLYGTWQRRLVQQEVQAQTRLAAAQAALAQGRARLDGALAELERVASTDPLTQCLNRRAFMQRLDFELARRTRYGTSFGLILLDIDHLKEINTRLGDAVGDQVLVAAADCLRSQLRPIDSLARWAGGQFLCLIVHVGQADLAGKAEDLRFMLSHAPLVLVPEEIVVTATLGAAVFRPELTLAETIARAERAMASAKSSGRNCVLVAA